MTNTEKFILKEKGAKEIVMSIISVFDGKSYKFANAALNAAKMFTVQGGNCAEENCGTFRH